MLIKFAADMKLGSIGNTEEDKNVTKEELGGHTGYW